MLQVDSSHETPKRKRIRIKNEFLKITSPRKGRWKNWLDWWQIKNLQKWICHFKWEVNCIFANQQPNKW
jgi:hypothetical protein